MPILIPHICINSIVLAESVSSPASSLLGFVMPILLLIFVLIVLL